MPELVCTTDDQDAWPAARRSGVTATDIVTILGLSSRASSYSLYWQKMGHVPETPDNDRMRLGRELEPIVLARWIEASGIIPLTPGGLYRHSGRSWQMATLDGVELAGNSPVELKTWADAARDMWQDDPPPSVRAQVLWQMDVMDAAAGHVGVLFLPSGEFRSHVIEHKHEPWAAGTAGPEDRTICPYVQGSCYACLDLSVMRAAGDEFMRRLRMELPPPDPDNSAATLAAARARFAKAKGKRGKVDLMLWNPYVGTLHELDRWQENKRSLEIQIREQLGEADEIEVDGELVGRRVVSDQNVKAHVRHMDYLRRVDNGKAGNDE